MNVQILYIFLFISGFLLILLMCEMLHKRADIRAEYTRKIGHTASTLASITLIYIFESHWYILVMSFLLFLLLFIGREKSLFHSIDGVPRKTSGSYLLPVSVYIMFLFAEVVSERLVFILPLLILGISDTIAGLSNGWHKPAQPDGISPVEKISGKTIRGSVVFFISALLISWITLSLTGPGAPGLLIAGLAVALGATIAERFSHRGWDNITVPLVSGLILLLFI
jgi:phytol kinase